MKRTILLIESDVPTRRFFALALETASYRLVSAPTAKEGIRSALSTRPDLILLALHLPDMSGADVITAIRKTLSTPIVVCSPSADEEEIVEVLERGADDYLSKPISPHVLLARIYATLNRVEEGREPDSIKPSEGLHLDAVKREVFVDGQKKDFTPHEFELLAFMLAHKGKTLTFREILRGVWGTAYTSRTPYLRVYIGRIRRKIEPDHTAPKYLVTKTGIGYRLEDAA